MTEPPMVRLSAYYVGCNLCDLTRLTPRQVALLLRKLAKLTPLQIDETRIALLREAGRHKRN